MCILNNIPLTQTRQPVFVQLLHHVYRVSQAVLGHQRVNVENCIKTLTEVGKFALSCGLLFHLTCIFSFYQFQVFMKELMIFFLQYFLLPYSCILQFKTILNMGRSQHCPKGAHFFFFFFFSFLLVPCLIFFIFIIIYFIYFL